MSSSLQASTKGLDCCRRGAIHTGTPTGKEITLAGREAYFSPAPNGNPVGALLYVTDAMGWQLNNARLLADTYAEEGNLDVYIPNVLGEDAIPLGAFTDPNKPFDLPSWARNVISLRPQHEGAYVDAVKELRSKYPHVAASGYCWGGYFTIRLAQNEGLVDCSVASHPSLVAVPSDIEPIIKPVLFVCAEVDEQFGDEKRETSKEVLAKKDTGSEFKLYPGTSHGFTVRASQQDAPAAKAAIEAKNETISWVLKHFGAK
ncbi:hypothetical protein Unana1_00051 [Umbelopsis nana]